MAEKKTEEATVDLNEVQKQIAEMMAQAKEEAAKIVAEAKAAAKGEVSSDEKERRAKELEDGEELVEVKLFKDNGKYKDDVFVGVNGETIAIKRGERVKIKRKFANVLDDSDKQDFETSRLIEAKSGEFAKSGL